MEEAMKARLTALDGFVILIQKPGDPVFYGPVENSFSLGVDANRTFFYWTSKERGMDGREWAEGDLADYRRKHPDWLLTLWDAKDAEKLPVVLNWELWLDAHEPSDQTVSGIKNKHEARNLRFHVKGAQHEAQPTRAVPLRATVTTL